MAGGTPATKVVTALALLCAAVLLCPATAAGSTTAPAQHSSCDRFTDATSKAVCQQIVAGVSRAPAGHEAAASPGPDAAVISSGKHAAPEDLNHQQRGNIKLAELPQLASDGFPGHEAVAELLGRSGYGQPGHPGHTMQEEEEEEEGDHKPWYYHDRDDDKPSYHEREEDPEPPHHSYKDPQEHEPYDGHQGHDYPPAQGSHPPPEPFVPLYTKVSSNVATIIDIAEGKENATGELTQEDVTFWILDQVNQVIFQTDNSNWYDDDTIQRLLVDKRYSAVSPASVEYTIDGNVTAPNAFIARCKIGARTEGSNIFVDHGPQGAGFPWQSAARYYVSVPQVGEGCSYTAVTVDGWFYKFIRFEGVIKAIKSPAMLHGTALDFVIDVLLGRPTNEGNFEVTCGSLQPPSFVPYQQRQSARNTSKVPELRPPAHFPGLRTGNVNGRPPAPKRFDHPGRVSWRPENDGPSSHDEYPYSRHSGDSRAEDLYSSLKDKHHGSYGQGSRPPPSPPTPEGGLVPSNFTYTWIELATNDVNAWTTDTMTGQLTQADFKAWGAYVFWRQDLHVLAEPIEDSPTLGNTQYLSAPTTGSAAFTIEGTVDNPTSISVRTQMAMSRAEITITPKFPWRDPTVVEFSGPAVGAFCLYSFIGPDGMSNFMIGTVTAVTRWPLAFTFKGTALDLVLATLTPAATGLHDVEYTCSFEARTQT